MKARLLAAACAVLLLAGCGGKKDKVDQRTASGEVLQGTISDDMLPLATVTSQPPKARPHAAASGSDSADDGDATDDDTGDATPDDAPPPSGDDGGD
jgi:hypothetical protein